MTQPWVPKVLTVEWHDTISFLPSNKPKLLILEQFSSLFHKVLNLNHVHLWVTERQIFPPFSLNPSSSNTTSYCSLYSVLPTSCCSPFYLALHYPKTLFAQTIIHAPSVQPVVVVWLLSHIKIIWKSYPMLSLRRKVLVRCRFLVGWAHFQRSSW